MSYGGRWVGLMATRERYVRQMPGRIVGAATDGSGRHGYVLTLQAREQPIRRDKATSTVRTNEAVLAAVGSEPRRPSGAPLPRARRTPCAVGRRLAATDLADATAGVGGGRGAPHHAAVAAQVCGRYRLVSARLVLHAIQPEGRRGDG